MIRNILFVIICFALCGCAAAGAIGASAVYLQKSPAEIVVTEKYDDVHRCKYIKTVETKVNFGGILLQDMAMERAISNLTHAAAECGADTLLIEFKSKEFTNSRAGGEAYLCAEGQ